VVDEPTQAEIEEELWEAEMGPPGVPEPEVPEPELEPPAPPEAPPPEAEPITVPDITIPKQAKVIEKMATGEPAVYEHKGEKYYAPPSTMHKLGFRTEKEYMEAQHFGATQGLHPGTLIKEGSIITTIGKDYRPEARYTPAQWGKLDPEYTNKQIKEGKYRIGVANYKSKEVLLTPKQIEKLQAAKTEKTRFTLLKKYGVVAPAAKFVTPIEAVKARKEAAAAAFTQQQFEKRNTQLPDGQWISKVDLAKVKTESPDVHKALTKPAIGGFAAANAYYKEKKAIYDKEMADFEKYQARHTAFTKQLAPLPRKRGGLM